MQSNRGKLFVNLVLNKQKENNKVLGNPKNLPFNNNDPKSYFSTQEITKSVNTAAERKSFPLVTTVDSCTSNSSGKENIKPNTDGTWLLPVAHGCSSESDRESEDPLGDKDLLFIAEKNISLEKNSDNSLSEPDFDSDDSVADKDFDPFANDNISIKENLYESSTESNLRSELFNPEILCNSSNIVSHDDDDNNEANEIVNFPTEKVCTRKRQKFMEKWKLNIKKKKRNSGQEYVSSTGKVVPQRTLKCPCKENCKYKCTQLITQEQRKNILTNYWNIGDLTRQRFYLSNQIDKVVSRYRYTREGSKRIGLNHSFHLINGTDRIRVCKKFFMATLNIGSKTISTALSKMDKQIGYYEGEQRGKHGNQKRTDPDVVEKIKEHIKSFPRIESHYLRQQTSREYISGDLNIAEMHRLYEEKCQERGEQPPKIHIYRNIFNNFFNIGFFIPKKDQCSLCTSYENSNEIEKKDLEEVMKTHKTAVIASRESKSKDKDFAVKNTENSVVACYDLQAVLNTPSGKVSNFHYSRKFASYNLTVFDMANSKGYCYLWNEDQAQRGANEIGTCVYDFLKTQCIGKDTIFYTDNCFGQQKNKYMVCMYLFATCNLNIPSITHNFLVVGHTQNEGDAMHSCIEKEKLRYLKGNAIYSPNQWPMILNNAKKTGSKFNVKEIVFNDILDLKDLTACCGDNFNRNTKGEKIIWKDVKVLRTEKKFPYTIFYKMSYEEEKFSEIQITNKTRRSKKQFQMPTEIKLAYSEARGISAIKKKDLVNLCNSKVIPSSFHSFFTELKVKQNTGSNDNQILQEIASDSE